jgi:DNA polymerase I-like protein with 3'-5' exonuclease and polymerase domains
VTLYFDIETDGLDATKVHCIAISEGETVEVYHDDSSLPSDGDLDYALGRLEAARTLVAHNGRGFDLPALDKVYGWRFGGEDRDTLIESRLMFSDLYERDARRKYAGFPGRLWGRHSIEAWGQRLGVLKGEYTGGWDHLSQDMIDYCAQDVRVLKEVTKVLDRQNYPQAALDLEYAFADAIQKMNERGVRFDTEAAEKLRAEMEIREAEVEDQLGAVFPDFKETYYTKVRQIEKTRVIPFNPGSRTHLVRALKEHRGWVPTEFTPSGLPKLDETTIKTIDAPEVPIIEESLMLDKRLGQLARGKKAWLDLVEDGFMRPYVNHMGAVTGRCTHSGPNVSQVPATYSPYGAECRSLWQPRPGFVLVGSDASSVELRILAHFLAPFDGGRLCRVMDSGADPHEANRKVCGIDTRDHCKTATYATLYGAGVPKLADSLGVTEARARAIRKKLKDGLGVGDLIEKVKNTARSKGYLRGLDGRRIPVRKLFGALNTLIQGNASVLLKKWTVLLAPHLERLGAHMILHVHDEVQIECPPAAVEQVQILCKNELLRAGESFGLRVTTPADTKTGASWAETH